MFFIASLCGSVIIQSAFHKHRGSFRNRFNGTSNLLSFCKSFLVLKLHKNSLKSRAINQSNLSSESTYSCEVTTSCGLNSTREMKGAFVFPTFLLSVTAFFLGDAFRSFYYYRF